MRFRLLQIRGRRRLQAARVRSERVHLHALAGQARRGRCAAGSRRCFLAGEPVEAATSVPRRGPDRAGHLPSPSEGAPR
eukprot:782812-Pyramimonas_sp.AAC.1